MTRKVTNPTGRGAPATVSDLQALQRDSQGSWSLDPAGSSAEFHVKHFWGAITVHGRFERLEGEGIVSLDGTVTGVLRLDAASLTTKNKRRDQHLRSADFFDIEHHPTVTITVALTAGSDGSLASDVHLETAGHNQQIRPVVQVVQAASGSVTLRAEVTVDRSEFGMTWSPLGMAARQAGAVITARFVRA
jgi:polyisoprenoid-binding protein YceI